MGLVIKLVRIAGGRDLTIAGDKTNRLFQYGVYGIPLVTTRDAFSSSFIRGVENEHIKAVDQTLSC